MNKKWKIPIALKDFLKQHEYLKEKSEEYLLKIDNGEKEQYDKTLQEIENCTQEATKNQLLRKAKSLKEKIQYRNTGQKITADNGAIGMSYICSLAKPNKELIYLSGSGADEIISDYGFSKIKHYGHSTIGGYFPNDLSKVFPWKNFFGNTQRAYLMKEETVTGTWGIEGRYPYLDKYVVQEFLWLSNELKNSNYKIKDRILYDNQKVIFTDEKGNITVYSMENQEIVLRYNFYKKKFKRNKKNSSCFNKR